MNWFLYLIWNNPLFWLFLSALNINFLYTDIFVEGDWSIMGAPLELLVIATCLIIAYQDFKDPYYGQKK
jgi:hypothetical protein